MNMSVSDQLDQIKQAIKTLENLEERETDSFRIVINSLRQKETKLLQKIKDKQQI